MENPTTIVKSAFNPSAILRWTALGMVALALADLLGVTDWILWPVSTYKSKFGKS